MELTLTIQKKWGRFDVIPFPKASLLKNMFIKLFLVCLKVGNIKIQNFTFSKSFKINQISLYILGRFLEPNVSISNLPRIFGHARAKWWLSGSHCQCTHRIQKYTRLSWDWNTCRNAWTNWTRNGDDNEVCNKEVDDPIVSISSVDGARSFWWLFVGMETAKHPKYWDIYNLNSGRIPFINTIGRCSDNVGPVLLWTGLVNVEELIERSRLAADAAYHKCLFLMLYTDLVTFQNLDCVCVGVCVWTVWKDVKLLVHKT